MKNSATKWLKKELEASGLHLKGENIVQEKLQELLDRAYEVEMDLVKENSRFWFGRGVLAGKENRISELKP